MATADNRRKRQQTLSVDLGQKLLGVVESLRRQIQDHVGTSRSISRGDVVRLAIRRLELAFLVHQANNPELNATARILWMDAAADLRIDGTCPDFLVPGHVDMPVAIEEPKKKEKKK